MEKNELVMYTGKGFLGFDKTDTNMVFLFQESFNSVWVLYKKKKMIVSPHEIISIKQQAKGNNIA